MEDVVILWNMADEARLGTALGPCVRLARLHCPELSREGAGKKLVSFLHVNKLLTI